MTKIEAQSSIIKLNREMSLLEPSALITMFEIDASDLAFDAGIITSTQYDNGGLIFRFHNNIKLGRTSVFWQGNEYIAAPITAEGFEIAAKGTLPIPRLSITSNESGISFLALLKEKIRQLDDLIGAKITRIRTFAKYLDAQNFTGITEIDNFTPDPNVEFPRDVYYIDRKASENKYSITFELASILDVEGLFLPTGTVLTDKCRWNYRGCGCFYEYANQRNVEIHGSVTVSNLPQDAPPVANNKNELITEIVGKPTIIVKGKWQTGVTYYKGEAIFIEKRGIKYYFVCNATTTQSSPPHSDWIADQCSQTLTGCKLRWANKDMGFEMDGQPIKGVLPFGGYPGTNKAIG